MSRIGKMPITVPSGVSLEVANERVKVSGPRGSLEWSLPQGIELKKEDGTINVVCSSEEKSVRSLHGLTRALLFNMVTGVSEGFEKSLDIVGVGYRAQLKGKDLEMTLGYSHPVIVKCPEGITFETPQPTKITVKGIDKQLVGEISAQIRGKRKPEPYKGKGVKYSDEIIRRKAGKAAK